MQDRVSLYPGRVKLVPVAGQENTYDMVRADSPTQKGMPLDKANLLSDDAEVALFGVANDRTVSEAFAGIGAKIRLIMKNNASITVTVKDQAGNAVKNVLVDGIYTEAGGAVYPAKDARMSAATFRAGFPRLAEFQAHRDPALSSGFWRRVMQE